MSKESLIALDALLFDNDLPIDYDVDDDDDHDVDDNDGNDDIGACVDADETTNVDEKALIDEFSTLNKNRAFLESIGAVRQHDGLIGFDNNMSNLWIMYAGRNWTSAIANRQEAKANHSNRTCPNMRKNSILSIIEPRIRFFFGRRSGQGKANRCDTERAETAPDRTGEVRQIDESIIVSNRVNKIDYDNTNDLYRHDIVVVAIAVEFYIDNGDEYDADIARANRGFDPSETESHRMAFARYLTQYSFDNVLLVSDL
jgi:hypothetical protein